MRKFFLAVLILCILAVGGYGAYRGYKIWKQQHLLKLAREFLAKSDNRNALLSVQQALRTNSRNLEACRMMAELDEAAGSPSSVFWRGRIVELQPDSLTNRLEWARAALATGDLSMAQKALESVDAAGKNTTFFHRIAGAVCVAARRIPEAEAHYAEIIKQDPTNSMPQLNLAVLQLQSTNAAKAASARQTLLNLTADPRVRLDALRHVQLDALRREDMPAAKLYSAQIANQTNAVFADRLIQLAVLQKAKDAQAANALTRLEEEAGQDPSKIYALTEWMLRENMAPHALAWLKRLPHQSVTNGPVPLIKAECFASVRDWVGLQNSLTNQNWGEMEFLKQAYSMRALRERGLDAAAKSEWQKVLKLVGNRLDRSAMIHRMVRTWKWSNEERDVLWIIVNHYPKETWALQALAEKLIEIRDTQSLLTLFARGVELNPENLANKNNLAMTAMLLEAWDKKPHEMSLEIFKKEPQNPIFLSTYGFSLYLQKKPADALKVFEQIPAKNLEDPSIAGYYGMALQAVGDRVKARKFLDLATRSPLLPEEVKLMDRARSKL